MAELPDLALLPERVNANATLLRQGRLLDVIFLVETGEQSWLVDVRRGRIDSVQRGPFVMPSWRFALRAPADEWRAFWQPVPPPGHHDLIAMAKRRALRIEGDLHPFMSHLFYFKGVMASLRDPRGATR